ncbi:MAG: type II toxin-antitoxin system YafQ family toxin [bacterium]|nr:type II toxin-antitoxin system YafQ family toxin [bacterium]
MRLIRYTALYKRSLKRISKSGIFPRLELETVIKKIQAGEKLNIKYKDHALSGDLSGNRECHIRSDLLLIYRIENDNLVLVLVNIGSHASLF